MNTKSIPQSYSSGYGPVPYIFLGELFPPERRGVATGAVSMAQCAFNFGALKMFPHTLQVSQKTNILVQLVLKSIFSPIAVAGPGRFVPVFERRLPGRGGGGGGRGAGDGGEGAGGNLVKNATHNPISKNKSEANFGS